MQSNVIAFKARAANDNTAVHHRAAMKDNVVSLAGWLNRAMPRRTPNGVFFTTRVLMTQGELA